MFSWRRKAPRWRRRRKRLGGSGGMLPQEIFKIEYSETPFPAFLEPRKQFPRQCWRSLKFSLKSKLLNENGQLVGGGGGRMATTEFSLAYHCEFIWFSKKMFGNLGCSPFIKSVVYSSRSEPGKSWIITVCVTVHVAKPESLPLPTEHFHSVIYFLKIILVSASIA